jgi:hypothetical protein
VSTSGFNKEREEKVFEVIHVNFDPRKSALLKKTPTFSTISSLCNTNLKEVLKQLY